MATAMELITIRIRTKYWNVFDSTNCLIDVYKRQTALGLSLFLITLVSPQTEAAEKHASQIVIQVLKSKRAMEQSPICSNGCVFLSAWDFDGTILKGDASEGLIENSKIIYPGLSQQSIEAGYSNSYTKHDFQKFWKEYEEMDKIQGHIPAYTYLAKILKGSHSEEVKKFAAHYYAVSYTHLRP